MENRDIILTRRSIRKYKKGGVVTKEQLDYILKAAFTSPNASNRQPWEFLIVDTDEAKNKILSYHKYCQFLSDATLAIIVLGDENINKEFWVVDCAIASENILLAANALGLGACLCCSYPFEDLMNSCSEKFNLPGNIKPFGIIVIGEADEVKEPALDRVNPSKIHYNTY